MQLAAGDFWFTTAPPEWLRPPDSSVPPLRSQSVAAAASVPLAAVVCEGTVVVNGGCLWRGRREVGPVTFQEGPAVATNAAEVDRGWLPDGGGGGEEEGRKAEENRTTSAPTVWGLNGNKRSINGQ